MLSSQLAIGKLNNHQLTNDTCEAIHTKLEGKFGLNGPLCLSNSIVGSNLACQINNSIRYLLIQVETGN